MKNLLIFLVLLAFALPSQAQCFTYVSEPTKYDTIFTTENVIVDFIKTETVCESVPAFTEQFIDCSVPGTVKICEKKHESETTTFTTLQPIYKIITKRVITVTAGKVRQKPCD